MISQIYPKSHPPVFDVPVDESNSIGISARFLITVKRTLKMQDQTRNVLDCDHSNYSSRIIFSCTFTLEPNTNRTGTG